MSGTEFALPDYLHHCQQRVNRALPSRLPSGAPAQRLVEAMRYSVENGGKRIRATLVYAAADALGSPIDPTQPAYTALDTAACAVELIHAYSLVHDDLPAMDNDELRRGKPTCHVAFGEATAILAGDALQTEAFLQLCRIDGLDAASRLRLVDILAQATGAHGMAGGQMLDLEGERQTLDLQTLETIHRHKTGDLICASVQLGATIANACLVRPVSSLMLSSLEQYARAIGLAFQVVDDLLDVEGDTSTLGKSAGSDLAHHKSTYPALLGVDRARAKARELRDSAVDALREFPASADPLRALANFIVDRNR